MPLKLFSLLCTMNTFDFKDNPGINKGTIAGYISCNLTPGNLTNLKDLTQIDASRKGLKGSYMRDLNCVEPPLQNRI